MKKFALFSTALALAISLIFPAFPARAVSNVDGVIKTTKNLVINRGSSCSSGSTLDVTNNHLGILQEGIKNRLAFQKNRYSPVDYKQLEDDYKHALSVFKRAVDNQGYYAIVKESVGFSYFAVEDKQDFSRAVITSSGVDVFANYPKLIYKLNLNFNGCRPFLTLTTSSSGTRHVFSPYYTIYKHDFWFVNTFPITYPDGYQGENIDDYSGVAKQVIRPDFIYNVDYKTLKAKDINQNLPKPTKLADGYTFKGYQVEWSLFSCGDGGATSISCPSPDLKKYGSFDQVAEFIHAVADYGKYKLSAQYLLQQCYRYPSYPVTPDRCVNLTNRDFKNYDFVATTVMLDINGKNISGDTRGMDCSELGYCEEKPELKDCSVHGVNIIAAIGCHLHNFFINLKNFFIFAFVPNSGHLRDSFSGFIDVLKKSLGFLWTPIDFIIKTVQLLTGSLPNPTGDNCSIGNVGFFGSQSRPLELCAWRHKLPDLWSMLRLFAQGAIAWLVISMFWRKFAHFFGIDVSGSGDDLDDSDGHRISDDYIIIDERRGISQKVGDYRKGGSH